METDRNFNIKITDRDGNVQEVQCDAFAIEDRFMVYEIDKIATFKPHALISEIVAEYTGLSIEESAEEIAVDAFQKH